MSMGDAVLILFAVVVLWIAIEMSGGGGGGHRARVPVLG